MTGIQRTKRAIRIGVDMGGTNTDAVILDLTPGANEVVLASTKAVTTEDISEGVQESIRVVLDARPDINREEIQAVIIGTTHFVNALVQRSEDNLERVAVIRLCGPFSRLTPPFASFPYELKDLLEGPHFFAEGGLQIDGSEISAVNEEELVRICEEIKRQGIRSVAISGVFSPIDFTIKQEEHAERIINKALPGVFTTCSTRVANLGLLERENATILNAALLPFAYATTRGFATAAAALRLDCPLFVTSNDGTLLTLDDAADLPIRTFSSGPTNSMRGASFLARLADAKAKKEMALVVDIGGTTTEVGVLLASGFPRQAAANHEMAGVRLNFPMPHVTSIGLGGGSLVKCEGDKVTVGPTSVGYRLTRDAHVFGGSILTATDIAVAAGDADIGDASKVAHVDQELIASAKARIKTMLELTLDSMKTSSDDIPVYLVGGGAMLAPTSLSGVSKVHRFPHYQCANAVGAAIAQVAGTVDGVENTENRSMVDVRKDVESRAISRAIEAGAKPDTVVIVESEAIPVAYMTGRCRFFVRVAGDWTGISPKQRKGLSTRDIGAKVSSKPRVSRVDEALHAADVLAYRPNVSAEEWRLSELDLEFISIGTYILGCGGGGSPHQSFLALREMVRRGTIIRVADLASLPPQGIVGWGGVMGSPEVISERLVGDEYPEALDLLLDFMKIPRLDALTAVEIGGSNGMINFFAGASTARNIPVLDGDFMGRAYPTNWQTAVNVYDDSSTVGAATLPIAIASGDGTSMFMTSVKRETLIDSALRAACVEMGTLVGLANRPQTAEACATSLIRNTVSLSWRIGRAVVLANKSHNVSQVGSIIIDALGGTRTARVLFSGKIVDLRRTLYKGHTVGEVVIQPLSVDEQEGEVAEVFEGELSIPFKNENLFCQLTKNGVKEVIATVPDLICVLDAQNGHALGTPDYRYGRRVLVLGITAAPQWTDTDRGLRLGDLRAFGYDDIPYKPIGEYVVPRSVIEEYS